MDNTPLVVLLIVLAAVGVLVFGLTIDAPVQAATAQANAALAVTQLPGGVEFWGTLSGWLVKALLGMIVTAIIVGIIIPAVKRWAQMRAMGGGKWKSGPNAYWSRNGGDDEPALSTRELLEMAMIERLMGGPATLPAAARPQHEEQANDGPNGGLEGWW